MKKGVSKVQNLSHFSKWVLNGRNCLPSFLQFLNPLNRINAFSLPEQNCKTCFGTFWMNKIAVCFSRYPQAAACSTTLSVSSIHPPPPTIVSQLTASPWRLSTLQWWERCVLFGGADTSEQESCHVCIDASSKCGGWKFEVGVWFHPRWHTTECPIDQQRSLQPLRTACSFQWSPTTEVVDFGLSYFFHVSHMCVMHHFPILGEWHCS